MRRRFAIAALLTPLLISSSAPAWAVQSSRNENATSRLVGEVFAGGRQMKYLSMLSDEVGSRLTGSAGARRAEAMMEAEMKRIGLENVRREPYTIPVSWERGIAEAWLISHGNRPLTAASYTWAPGTGRAIEGDVVEVGAGRPET
jgi:hypothetical protein